MYIHVLHDVLWCVCVCAGVPVKRPSVDELMDPNGPYSRRQVDVSGLVAEKRLLEEVSFREGI